PAPAPRVRAEPRRGLGWDERGGAGDHPAGDPRPAPHAAGIGARRLVLPLREADGLEQLARALLPLAPRHAVEPAVEVQALPRGEIAVHRVGLRDHTDLLPHGLGVTRDV